MKYNTQYIACFVTIFNIAFLLQYKCWGQNDSMKKMYRLSFAECESFIQKGKYDKALLCLEETNKQFPDKIRTYVRMAEIYYLKKEKLKCLKYINMAIDANANEAYAPLTFLANKMMSNKDDDLGMAILGRLSIADLDTLAQKKVEKDKLRHTLRSAVDRSYIGGINLYNLGTGVNTKENEYLPSLSLDGNTLVFTRNTGGNEDFFVSQKDTIGKWNKAINMGYPPNTNLPDGGAKLSADSNYLFYTRCDIRSPDGIRGGGCDLVFSYRTPEGWSTPQYFGYTVNTHAYEGMPCLSSDNKSLYFVSNREGGYGGMDIWVTRFENNLWTKPINLGPNINTEKDETSPFIHPDNETLYFASNGHLGLGNTDLYISRKNKDGSWKKPLHIGAPINSEGFEGSMVVNARGTTGYMAAERKESIGGLDIYSFEMYPAIQPIPTVCLKGFVIDKYYKTPQLNIKLDFTYDYNGENIGREKSNGGDGSYHKALQMGKTYTLFCEAEGYRIYRKKLAYISDTLPDNIYMDIKLKQPGIIDSLYKCDLWIDTLNESYDSLSMAHLQYIIEHWEQWVDDNADVHIFIKNYYYSGDSLSDTNYIHYVEKCLNDFNWLEKYFKQHNIPCRNLMHDPDMLILNDEKKYFRKIEIAVVEYY